MEGRNWRTNSWWPDEAQKSALQNSAVYWIHLGKAQEKGIAFRQTKSHAIIACSTLCHQTASSEWSHSAEKWRFTSDLQPHDLPHVLFSIVLGMSSSNSSSRVVWGVAGNCRDVVQKVFTTMLKELRATAANTLWSKKTTRFKSISEFMEYHKASSTRMRSG